MSTKRALLREVARYLNLSPAKSDGVSAGPALCRLVGAALVVFALGGATSRAQNLKFVPTIDTVQPFKNLLSGPGGVAADAEGKVYVADTAHSKVWMLDTTQTVTLFAGRGSSTYTGDNGAAENATLSAPLAVATDLAGDVYIADTGNFAVRRVDAVTGVITTVAGGNGLGYSGDGGPATAARFMGPSGLAVDPAGNVYVSDAAAGVVREISTAGVITTFAGGGNPTTGNGDGGAATAAKLLAPYGLALDATGSLYVADATAGLVRRVSGGVISTFAGSTIGTLLSQVGFGGPATSAKLRSPRGVAVDSTGLVYLTDAAIGFAAVVDGTGKINILAGLGTYGAVGDGLPASEVPDAAPYGIAVDPSGNAFLSSNTQNAIYEVIQHPERFPMTRVGNSTAAQRLVLENTGTTAIALSSVLITGDFVLAPNLLPNASPCTSTTLVGTGFGNFCTLDVVFMPAAAGIRTFPLTVASNDSPATQTINLTSTGLSAALATTGGVIDTVAGEPFSGLETIFGDNVPATQTQLNGINGLTTDSAGNTYFSEYGYCHVRRVDAKTGIITTIAGLQGPNCSQTGPNGDGGPATQAQLYLVGEVAFGPDGTLYIADDGHNQIRSVDASGNIHTLAGNGSNVCAWQGDGKVAATTPVCGANGMATDSKGNVFYSDGGNQIIVKVSTAGILTRVAGVVNTGPTGSFSGDGGPAVNASFYSPWGLAVDKSGDIFVSDRHNDVVRRIDGTTGVITTVAGTPGVAGYTGDGGPATSATLSFAADVALDNAGDLYISDSQNNVIRRVDGVTGVITTVGGIAANNLYNGNGLPATDTAINYPETVAVDPGGYVLFGDRSWLVREISPNGTIRFAGQSLNTTSAAQTVTVSNIGNTPLHFDATTPYTVTGDFAFASGGTCNFTQALAPGASCTVLLTFTPVAPYTRFGALGLYNDGIASPQLTQLIGAGTTPSAPLAVLSPTTIAFSNQNVGTSSGSATVTVSNPGNATLSLGGISFTGSDPSDFSQNSTCGGTLAAGAQCTIAVTFTPATARAFSASLALADNAAGSPQTVTLSGTGVTQQPQALLTPGIVTFPATVAGGSAASQTVVLSNPGNATLNISSIALAGANPTSFGLTNLCGATLAAGATCNLTVTFSPAAAASYSATVLVTDNAAGSPQSAILSGTGTVAPTLTATLTPATVAFASQLSGTTSAAQTLTLANTGNASISISSVALAGANPTAFGLSNGCGATLGAGAQCLIAVTFAPGSAGQFAATVAVTDTAAGSPQTSALTGTGTSPPEFNTASPTPPQTVTAGGAATYLINVTSVTGSFNLPVTLTAAGLPPGATVTFTPPVVTPGAAGANSTMVVQTAAVRAAGLAVSASSAGRFFETAGAILLLCVLTMRRLPRLTRPGRLWLLLGSLAVLSLGLSGCGGGFPQPSGSATYVIAVTGTNGTDQHSTSVTLTVQ